MTNYNERLDEILMTFLFNGYGQDAEVYMPAADGAKQALTSLTKELVAEAKPERNVVITVVDKVRNNTIDEFEQNLLKALEEV